ncbi:tripartite tricarboxylate transporter substrate binding protein [soil metagenome]
MTSQPAARATLPFTRNLFMLAVATAALTTFAIGASNAQTIPAKQITIVVPYAAGAAPDQIVRMIAPKLQASIGQPVIVDNKPGASGNIGASFVAKAAPDGSTILLATQPMITINPHLFKSMGFDPATDLTPITSAVNVVMALSVNQSLPVNNLSELIAYAKKNPGTPYGTSGVGTPMHLAGLAINSSAGVDLNHIAYRGGALVLNDLLADTLKVGIVDYGSSKQFVDAGKLKILAVGEKERFSGAPQIPTVGETILGFAITSWFGFYGPGKMSPALAEKWSNEIKAALNDPEIKARLFMMGMIVRPDGPAQLDALGKSEFVSFGKLVRDNKVTVE